MHTSDREIVMKLRLYPEEMAALVRLTEAQGAYNPSTLLRAYINNNDPARKDGTPDAHNNPDRP